MRQGCQRRIEIPPSRLTPPDRRRALSIYIFHPFARDLLQNSVEAVVDETPFSVRGERKSIRRCHVCFTYLPGKTSDILLQNIPSYGISCIVHAAYSSAATRSTQKQENISIFFSQASGCLCAPYFRTHLFLVSQHLFNCYYTKFVR